jgi:hypothetical protein
MKKTFLAIGIGACLSAYSQIPTIPTGGSGGSNPLAALAGLGGAGASAKPKAYKDVITDKAKTKKGLFTVHKVEDKYYFEIPDDLFGQEILAVTRYTKVAGGGGVYGGEEVNTQTLRFEKGPNNNVFLRVLTLISYVDSSNTISKAVRNSNVDPISNAFNIACFGKDSTGAVIDVTEFFKGDNQVVSISPNDKRRIGLSNIAGDRSYIQSINTYPINTEIRTVKTYNSGSGGSPFGLSLPGGGGATLPAASLAGAVTVELNTSLL